MPPRSSSPELAPRPAADAGYSPSRLVPGFRAILAEYRRRSDVAKRSLPCELNVPYGPGAGEAIHHFPPRWPAAPLLVYVHGGHWQELGIDDSCFAAPALVARGAGFAALGYPLAPGASLDAIVAAVSRGLEWVVANAAALGTSAAAIYAAGSSAGAHLLAMALGSGPAAASAQVAGAVLISGVYELDGIRRSYVNQALGLSPADALRNSPLRHLPLRAGEVLVARGEAETAAYRRQHESLLAALRGPGGIGPGGNGVHSLVSRGRNHFDLPLCLGDPAEELGRAVLAQMGLGRRRDE